jgi:hypothetical protein
VFALCDGVGNNGTGSVLFPFSIAVGPPLFSLLSSLFHVTRNMRKVVAAQCKAIQINTFQHAT